MDYKSDMVDILENGPSRRLFRKLIDQQRRRKERGEGEGIMGDVWALALSGDAELLEEISNEIETAKLIRKAALSAAMTAIESNPPRTHEVPAEQLKSETDDLLAFLRKKGHI